MAKKEKKVNISKMNYIQLIYLLTTNQEVNINGGVLFVVLREFERHLTENYILKSKVKLLTPDKSIVKPNGEKIKSQ